MVTGNWPEDKVVGLKRPPVDVAGGGGTNCRHAVVVEHRGIGAAHRAQGKCGPCADDESVVAGATESLMA